MLKRREWCFSLIEMMVAVGVMGVAVVGITQALSQTNETNRRLEQRRVALGLVEMKLAEFAEATQIMAPQSGKFEPPFDDYEWKAEIVPAKVAGVFELAIEVSWPGRRGRRSQTATTLVPQR